MSDPSDPSADKPHMADVNIGALSRPEPPPEVDPQALQPLAHGPEVEPEALSHTATPTPPPAGRRRRVLQAAGLAVVIALCGGGFWWRHEVTADPGLEFSGGRNVARDEAGTDRSGIGPRESFFRSEVDEVEVAFVPNGRLYATVGLFNGGGHDVRIEDALPGAMWNWGFDRMAVAPASEGGVAGFTARYEPLRPFTLHRGETRELRLEFRLADCDPASVNPGAFSTLQSLTLRYRILGLSRTTDVPFRDVGISLPTMGNCAHPIIGS